MEIKTVYFERAGKENTDVVFEIVNRRAGELGIKTVVIASTTGETGVQAVNSLKGVKVIVVGHRMGSRAPNVQAFTPEN